MKADAQYELTPEHAAQISEMLSECEYVTGMRKNASGEVRFHAWKSEWTADTFYWWSTGNMGCDCNRHLIFHDYSESCYEDDMRCGESQYTLVGVWFPDGSDIRDLQLLNEH